SYFLITDTPTPDIYTLSLHDALPICRPGEALSPDERTQRAGNRAGPRCSVHGNRRRSPRPSRIRTRARGLRSAHARDRVARIVRSEEHTSELQSQSNLVCRLLLEKKK